MPNRERDRSRGHAQTPGDVVDTLRALRLTTVALSEKLRAALRARRRELVWAGVGAAGGSAWAFGVDVAIRGVEYYRWTSAGAELVMFGCALGMVLGAGLGWLRGRGSLDRERCGTYQVRTFVMHESDTRVFFYGLFMDEGLLAAKGIRPADSTVGYVDRYRLRIGKRATLVPDGSSRAYGVLMTLRRADLTALYSDLTVADYVAEEVTVTLPNGAVESALCYNLPEAKLEGTNASYAAALLRLAETLGFPAEYLETIKRERERSIPRPS
jgi:hypothetical protein